jgi:hypothetical protein
MSTQALKLIWAENFETQAYEFFGFTTADLPKKKKKKSGKSTTGVSKSASL